MLRFTVGNYVEGKEFPNTGVYGKIIGSVGENRRIKYQVQFINGNNTLLAASSIWPRTFDPNCKYFDDVESDDDDNQSQVSLGSKVSINSNKSSGSVKSLKNTPSKKRYSDEDNFYVLILPIFCRKKNQNLGNVQNIYENTNVEQDPNLCPNDKPWYYGLDRSEETHNLYDNHAYINFPHWLHQKVNKSNIDYYKSVFPPRIMDDILLSSNENLKFNKWRLTSRVELFKLFGIRYAIMIDPAPGGYPRYWNTDMDEPSVIMPRCFEARFGMSYTRFRQLMFCIKLTLSPKTSGVIVKYLLVLI